jgi:hypothetical protein
LKQWRQSRSQGLPTFNLDESLPPDIPAASKPVPKSNPTSNGGKSVTKRVGHEGDSLISAGDINRTLKANLNDLEIDRLKTLLQFSEQKLVRDY